MYLQYLKFRVVTIDFDSDYLCVTKLPRDPFLAVILLCHTSPVVVRIMEKAEALGMLSSEYIYLQYHHLMSSHSDVLVPWNVTGQDVARKDLFQSTLQVR